MYRQPIKLVDCFRHGPGSGAELFVVEGDSAAGTVATVRDAQTQAVLPLMGKPLNAVKASIKKVETYPLFVALAEAIGAGVGAAFDLAGAWGTDYDSKRDFGRTSVRRRELPQAQESLPSRSSPCFPSRRVLCRRDRFESPGDWSSTPPTGACCGRKAMPL